MKDDCIEITEYGMSNRESAELAITPLQGICRDLASVGPTGLAEVQTANALARRLVEVLAGRVQFVDTPGTTTGGRPAPLSDAVSPYRHRRLLCN